MFQYGTVKYLFPIRTLKNVFMKRCAEKDARRGRCPEQFDSYSTITDDRVDRALSITPIRSINYHAKLLSVGIYMSDVNYI